MGAHGPTRVAAGQTAVSAPSQGDMERPHSCVAQKFAGRRQSYNLAEPLTSRKSHIWHSRLAAQSTTHATVLRPRPEANQKMSVRNGR